MPPRLSISRKYSSASSSRRLVCASMKYEPPSGSATWATSVSSAMICWVRSAILTAFSVGSASVSSIEFVCSDCVPPRTAARASIAVRTMLFSGCCAVSDTPAVCVWKRIIHERGSVAPNSSRSLRAQMRRAARNLQISSKKSRCASKKNDRRGGELRRRPCRRRDAALHVLDAVASVKASSCRGRARPRGCGSR